MESNQYQEFLADEVRRIGSQRRISLSIRKINQVHDKLGRIQALEPLITLGTLRFSRRHRLAPGAAAAVPPRRPR